MRERGNWSRSGLLRGRRRLPEGKAAALALVAAGFALFALLAGEAYRAHLARAGTALRMDVRELVAAADLVVEGRVHASRTLLGPLGLPETELELSVDRTHLGTPAGDRVLRLPGGTLPDGSGLRIAGLPIPAPGSEVLLFLAVAGEGELCIPVGLAQGSYRLLRDARGKRLALRDQGGMSLAASGGGGPRGAVGEVVMDYAELLAEIEAGLAARGRRRAPGAGGR